MDKKKKDLLAKYMSEDLQREQEQASKLRRGE